MVDRITPATVPADLHTVQTQFKIEDGWPVVCEPFIQWVIEDNFATGRPHWERVGAQFVVDVVPYENMKLRLLNAGHSVLGILGALHGYATIDQAASDPEFNLFLRSYMDVEAGPILTDLESINLEEYKENLIERFQNKNIKDQVSRICLQSSAKIPKFVLPTVRGQLACSGSVERAALLLAAWCKYCEGVDENGQIYAVEDEMCKELRIAAEQSHTDMKAFLKLKSVFGDLGNNERFVEEFCRMLEFVREKRIKECVREMNIKYKNN